MGKTLDYEAEVAEAQKRLADITLATGFRPHSGPRRKPRSRSEQRALCMAVWYAVEEARRTGLIVKTERGYRMQW